MAKKKKVIAFKAIEKKPPVVGSIAYITALEVFHAPGWLRGAALTILSLGWLSYIISIWTAEDVDPFEEPEPDGNSFQQKIDQLKNQNR